MKSAVSRAVVAVSVVAALGASAACSAGGDDDGKKSAKPGASGGAAAKLEKAALATGDVKGYKIEKPEAAEAEGADRPTGKPSPAECAPLAAVLDVGAPSKPKARAGRVVTPTSDEDVTTTRVELSAFAEADAKKAMADLSAATKSKKCADFRVGDQRYFGVEALPAPDKGDEAISYKVAQRKGEYVTRESATVVRSGSTLVAFDASNLYDPEGVQRDKEAAKDGMDGTGTPTADEDPKVAPALVDAQLAKL
ncbi:hypothetical protein AB0B50_18480 [Streptomyces sp. NPDC041068]|uniref:hypothetical protein n=1 Tax=Streptomyces sp. NPDC041068 TaxID=3155130 RepID=UPI0033DEDE15